MPPTSVKLACLSVKLTCHIRIVIMDLQDVRTKIGIGTLISAPADFSYSSAVCPSSLKPIS